MKKLFSSLLLWGLAMAVCFADLKRAPEAPHNFVQTAPINGANEWHSVRMTWTYPKDSSVLGIHIFVSTDFENWLPYDLNWANAVQIDNLNPKLTYYFRITSYSKDHVDSKLSPIIQWTAPTSDEDDGKL